MAKEHRAEFRFYEELNDFLPQDRRKRTLDYGFSGHPAIKDSIEAQGVPHTEVELILVNGESVGFGYRLQDGDRVAVYPMFESFDITPLLKLREAPLRNTAFVLDVNLGKLARRLRLLGFDALYSNRYEDAEIADIAAAEQRIVLTRDRRLLHAKRITHGYWVRSVHADQQTEEVLRRFDLHRQVHPFCRCAACNGLLVAVDKAEVFDRLEPLTQLYYDDFLICGGCGKIYWEGSHIGKMRQRICITMGTLAKEPLMTRLTLTRPDDWHTHLRDGAALAAVVGHTARQFARAIVMPNLKPPVTTVDAALAYRERILQALPAGAEFEPLMTLYLTEATPIAEVKKAAEHPHVYAFKLYPAGATTNSDAGVGHLERVYPLLEAMEKWDLPLLVHGEVVDADIDIFDRERVFIERELAPIIQRFAGLRVVLEHATTADAVRFVREAGPNVAATLTAHHLLYNRNALLAGGVRPHFYCLPVLKRESHRQALVEAATSGEAKFFLGTDSAPHPVGLKESACGCAGCYTAHAALELYAEAFEAAGKLENLERFASFNGPDFYRLPRNRGTVTLEKASWEVPASFPFGSETLKPLRAGEGMVWKML